MYFLIAWVRVGITVCEDTKQFKSLTKADKKSTQSQYLSENTR